MVAGEPGDHAHLRATDIDRSMACAALDSAYADGELDGVEYHHRLDSATTAKTRGELLRLLDDLQVPHPLTEIPSLTPAPVKGKASQPNWVLFGGIGAVVVAVVAAISVIASAGGNSSPKTPRGTATTVVRTVTVAAPTAPTAPRGNYTANDTQLLALLPPDFTQNACYHKNPTNGEIAELHCAADDNQGIPEAGFFLYPDAATMQRSYDADRADLDHVACADGTQDGSFSDAVQPGDAGRYSCFNSNGAAVVPTIEWSTPRDRAIGTVFADNPNGAQALLTWWRQHGQLR